MASHVLFVLCRPAAPLPIRLQALPLGPWDATPDFASIGSCLVGWDSETIFEVLSSVCLFALLTLLCNRLLPPSAMSIPHHLGACRKGLFCATQDHFQYTTLMCDAWVLTGTAYSSTQIRDRRRQHRPPAPAQQQPKSKALQQQVNGLILA